jgi:hypothetical protein
MLNTSKFFSAVLLAVFMVTTLPTAGHAKGCKKIKKIYKAQFGTASFKQDIKPFTPGWYKKDAWEGAVEGLESYLESQALTPYGQSTIYEYIAQIYARQNNVENRRVALENVLLAKGFDDNRNTYIRFLIEDLDLPSFEDKAERIKKRTRIPQYPPNFDKKSGHCKVSFSLNPEGSPKDLNVIYCTDPALNEEAIISAKAMMEFLPTQETDTKTLEKRRYTGIKLQNFNSRCNLIYPE